MIIEKDKVATFHYTLTEEGAGKLEDSRPDDPVTYLHGHQPMLQGLVDALAGKQPGDSFTVTIPPEKGYGERMEAETQRVPIKYLLNKGKLKPGMIVQVNTKNGARDATIVKVGKFNVDLDVNHPFAGKTLIFDVEVLDVRDAEAAELEHGHVHGAGGVQH